MARPGFEKHPKFKRLVRILGVPKPHVRGYIETLWDTCYENGEPYLGDADMVEAAAEWPGDPGVLTAALLAAGGDGRAGFIEEIPGRPGAYQVHDLFDHAPDYVETRREREQERKKEKRCTRCGDVYVSRDSRSKFCSDACRQAAHREKAEKTVTDVTDSNGELQTVTDVTQPLRNVTDRNSTPAPAPAPAPKEDAAARDEPADMFGVFETLLADWNACPWARRKCTSHHELPNVGDLNACLADPWWVANYKRALTSPLPKHWGKTASMAFDVFLRPETLRKLLGGSFDLDERPARGRTRNADAQASTDEALRNF